jgi:hypothetical protein
MLKDATAFDCSIPQFVDQLYVAFMITVLSALSVTGAITTEHAEAVRMIESTFR